MPENEKAISYAEVKHLIKQTANKARLQQFDKAIENDIIGVVYAYRKGSIAFEIKRYRTGHFIKKSY